MLHCMDDVWTQTNGRKQNIMINTVNKVSIFAGEWKRLCITFTNSHLQQIHIQKTLHHNNPEKKANAFECMCAP